MPGTALPGPGPWMDSGNGALQTAQWDRHGRRRWPRLPAAPPARGPLRAALPPARPQAGASQAPSSPRGERAPRQSAPPPWPASAPGLHGLQISDRLAGSWDPAPHKAVGRGRQQPGPGHPGATARPPAEASPAQAWPCLPRPFRGPPAPPDAPHGPPRSRLTRRREVSQPSSPLATQPARPVQAPAAVLASCCRAPERHRSFRPRRSPAPCPGMSAAHRRAWGWAGLARADSSGNSTTSRPRRGLRAP